MTDINPNLASLAVPIADLKLAQRNVKQHGDRSVDAIAASLVAYGQQKPIVVLEDGTVIAGNGTLLAAQKLGWESLAVVRFADAAKARAYAIADNRTPELAPWDQDELAAALDELSRAPEWDPAALGYSEDEVANLLGVTVEPDEAAESSLPSGGFGDFPDVIPDTVAFRCGDYHGQIDRAVYDSFVTTYQSKQRDTEEPLMTDVLRAWLAL